MQKLCKKETEWSDVTFKNAVIHKGACRVCGDLWTDLSNKNQCSWWETHQWTKSVESLQNTLQISESSSEICSVSFSKNMPWNKNEMLEYLRTCYFLKNVVFNATEDSQQGQEYHGPGVWQRYKELDIDIFDFVYTSMHLLYLGSKKCIISMIPTLLKQILRQMQDFGRLAIKSLD